MQPHLQFFHLFSVVGLEFEATYCVCEVHVYTKLSLVCDIWPMCYVSNDLYYGWIRRVAGVCNDTCSPPKQDNAINVYVLI